MNLLILLLTLSTALAQMPPVPSMAPLPPQTNRYFITMNWTNSPPCAQFMQVQYGTNFMQYDQVLSVPWTSNMTVNVSNLSYGVQYHFNFELGCDPRTDFDWPWPHAQLPLTNTVTIGCTGPLQMKLLGLNSAWVDVTNKVFRLRQEQSYFWRSKARETLTIAMSNNQVNYGQFMHRQ